MGKFFRTVISIYFLYPLALQAIKADFDEERSVVVKTHSVTAGTLRHNGEID